MAARTVNTTAETFTLTGTTVDTITVTPTAGAMSVVRIINRDGAGTTLWVTAGYTPASGNGQTVPNPTAGGSNCHPVPDGEWWALDFRSGYYDVVTVKVLGNGGAYTVEVERA
jgi:hypothetical protein